MPSYRLALLKQNPRSLSDRDLAMAATYLLAERTTIGPERVDRVMRELYRRGIDETGISRLTGFPRVRVWHALHRPRLQAPRRPSL